MVQKPGRRWIGLGRGVVHVCVGRGRSTLVPGCVLHKQVFNQPVLVSILWHDVSHAVRLLLELLIGQACVRQTVEEWDTGQGGSSVPRTLRSTGFSPVANCRHRCESVKKSRLDCGSGFLLVGWQFDYDGGSTLRLLQSGHQGEDSRGLQGHLKVGDDLGEAGTNIWRHVPSSNY